jgi:hypothetical protein
VSNPSVGVSRALPVLVFAAFTSGCEAIEGIFKAGFWVGAIAVLIVVGIVAFVAAKVRQA